MVPQGTHPLPATYFIHLASKSVISVDQEILRYFCVCALFKVYLLLILVNLHGYVPIWDTLFTRKELELELEY